MNVMCIDATDQTTPPFVKEGETYTIHKESVSPGRKLPCYSFIEFDDGEYYYWFKKSRFIHLSEIDETEMVIEKGVQCS